MTDSQQGERRAGWNRVKTGSLLCLLLAVLLVRLRAVSYSWALPNDFARILFGVNTPAVLASLALTVYMAALIRQVIGHDEGSPHIAEVLLGVALFIAVPWFDDLGLHANSVLVLMSVETEQLVGEPVIFAPLSPWICTSPFTIPDHARSWEAVDELVTLRARTSDRPADPSQPYVAAAAERTQAKLGLGDLGEARRELTRLSIVDHAGTLWRVLEAKFLYSEGNTTAALETVRLATQDSGKDGDGLAKTVASFEAYYGAALASGEGDWRGTSDLLGVYWDLSHDAAISTRVESDPAFESYVQSEEYSTSAQEWGLQRDVLP